MLTFFMTTIENATDMWERYGQGMKNALFRHDEIFKKTLKEHNGQIVKHTGEGFFVVFEGGSCLHCAIDLQQQFQKETWEGIESLKICIGIHCGEAEKRENDYFGIPVNRTARIMTAAWGGQILLSDDVKERYPLPDKAQIKDLGVHILQDLGEPQHIYQLSHPDLGIQEFPPIRSLSNQPHNLPAQTTPFVGREKELATVLKLMDDPGCRLISLVGPGGIGKTRIALQAGAEKVGYFPHGVYFVPLDDLTISSMQFLVFTIADALRFTLHGKQNPKVQLLNYLREKAMLIILDNFEHLVEESTLITEIFSHTQGIKFLVTSRERLNLPGEFPIDITGFVCPKDHSVAECSQYASIQLFLQSAQRVEPGFELQESNMDAICHICQRVEGIPLGIELAASWVRALTCDEIDKEIDKGMDFLTSTLRDVPERHRSLRSVFNYSWDLLSKKEQKLCMHLSVFEGGFSGQAAIAVARATLVDLATLADKSLLRRHVDGRYEVQKILRQYAREKILKEPQEHADTIRLHAQYFADFLHKRRPLMEKVEQITVFKEISTDIENIRTACHWAIDTIDCNVLNKISNSLFIYFDRKGWYQEGEQLFQTMAHKLMPHAESAQRIIYLLYGKTIYYLGRFLRCLGRYAEAEDNFKTCYDIFSELNAIKEMSSVLLQQSIIAMRKGELDNAEELSKQAYTLSTQTDNKSNQAQAYTNLGVIAFFKGDHEHSYKMHQQALALRQELRQLRSIAGALNNLANITHTLGKKNDARKLYEQSLEIHRKINNQAGLTITYGNIGLIHQELKEYEKAKHYFELSIDIARQIGDPEEIVIPLNSLGSLNVMQKCFDEAQRTYTEALEVAIRLGITPRIIAVFYGIAELLIACNRYDKAAVLCLYIMQQPKYAMELSSSVERKLQEIRLYIPEEQLKKFETKIVNKTLEHMIKEAKTYLSEIA